MTDIFEEFVLKPTRVHKSHGWHAIGCSHPFARQRSWSVISTDFEIANSDVAVLLAIVCEEILADGIGQAMKFKNMTTLAIRTWMAANHLARIQSDEIQAMFVDALSELAGRGESLFHVGHLVTELPDQADPNGKDHRESQTANSSSDIDTGWAQTEAPQDRPTVPEAVQVQRTTTHSFGTD